MRLRNVAFLCLILSTVGVLAGVSFSEDKPAPPMGEEEMWAKMVELATPGPMHKHLQALIGDWKVSGKAFTGKGEVPFTGYSVNKWIMGGRFVSSENDGDFMGQPFEGYGLVGYDNGKQEYQSVWAMTMGTGIDMSSGSYNQATSTFTFAGKILGPDGKTYARREVVVIKGADEIVSTMYATPPGGKEFKEMEIVYTRDSEEDNE